MKRRSVLRGMVTAWVATVAFLAAGLDLTGPLLLPDGPAWEAAARGIGMAAASLAVAIGLVAGHRFRGPGIDGARPPSGSTLDILRRNVTNTTEQVVLFASAALALAVSAPGIAQGLLPLMGFWFVVGRAVFLVGYLHDPMARAFGFAATFHPSVVLLALALWHLT